MEDTVRFVGIAGSLRSGSYNRAALRAAVELAPPGVEIVVWDRLREVPPYDADVEAAEGPCEAIVELARMVGEADGVLIASPEYNWSIPGALKNALDWASRGEPVFAGKVGAIMGVSGGPLGTARMQYHLRMVLGYLDMVVVPKPEVMIGMASQRFDSDGFLVDEASRGFVVQLVERARDLALQLRRGALVGR